MYRQNNQREKRQKKQKLVILDDCSTNIKRIERKY